MHSSIPASQCNTQICKFKGGRGKRGEGGGGKERRRVQERECLVYVFFSPSPDLSLLTNQPFPRNKAQINRLASEHSQNLLGSQNIQRGQINSPFSVCPPLNTPASRVKLRVVIIQGDKKKMDLPDKLIGSFCPRLSLSWRVLQLHLVISTSPSSPVLTTSSLSSRDGSQRTERMSLC